MANNTLKYFFLFMTVFLIKETHQQNKKCRVLGLRSGGTKGAYEVGVMKSMFNLLDPEEIKYDVVVGVSVGSLNGAFLSLYEKGKEKEALVELEKFWTSHLVQDYWKTWKGNVLASIWEASFFDNSPMLKMVTELIGNKTFQRKVAFQSVDFNTGKPHVFEEDTPQELIPRALLASASIPGAFPPQYIDNKVLVDGGLCSKVNIEDAIQKCREDGFKDEDIIVDMILCFGKPAILEEWTLQTARWKNSKDYFKRSLQFKNYYKLKADVERAFREFPKVNFRYIVSPTKDLPAGSVPIFATWKEQYFQMNLGYEDFQDLYYKQKGQMVN